MADPDDTRDYLKKWIESFQKASDSLPGIQKSYELIDWQCKALCSMPEEKRKSLDSDTMSLFTRNYGEIRNVLPMIPTYNPQSVTLCGSLAVSGASATFDHISKTGDLSNATYRFYYETQAENYHKVQQSQNRIDDVRKFLGENFSEGILRQFDVSVSTYYSAKSGIGERTSAAGEMRTLLDQVKGEIWQKARSHSDENMNWDKMAQRLIPYDKSPILNTQLLDQEKMRSNIYDELSTIFKRREGTNIRNLDDVWTKVLDHLYVISNCLNNK